MPRAVFSSGPAGILFMTLAAASSDPACVFFMALMEFPGRPAEAVRLPALYREAAAIPGSGLPVLPENFQGSLNSRRSRKSSLNT